MVLQNDVKFYRYRTFNVLLLTWLAYCAYVSSRRPFGVVRRTVEQEESLSAWELGMVDTCFLGMYTVGQFFYGEIKMHLNPRNTIALGLIVSSVSLWAFSTSSGFYAFAFLWAVNGVANACGWPSCIRIITPWIRPEERGRIMGLWASCQAAGGIVGNTAAAYFLGSSGWRAAVAQSAVFVGVVGLANWKFLVDHPNQVGFEDQDPSPDTVSEKKESETKHLGTMAALRVPGVMPVAISHFCEKIIRYTLLFWLPYYLTRRLNYDKVVSGYAATAFDIGGVLGSIVSGFVADSWGGGSQRITICVVFLATAGLSLLPFSLFPELFMNNVAFPVTGCFFIGLFLLGFDSLLTGAVIQDIATRGGVSSHVSAISGVIGGSGSFGSMLQGFLTTLMIQYFSWEALWVALIMLVAIACGSLLPTVWKERERPAKELL
eukprot:TRINITY_DN25464_c0_g1_i1.p1 TRINITY_DN25464_c0_g1~~TRINITY_DN25464_c0_g1_i1.p1  ORF type:complete len:444 (+),score=112.67 TRINITY_DN25464_c0_g1_i1:35-1333(+)